MRWADPVAVVDVPAVPVVPLFELEEDDDVPSPLLFDRGRRRLGLAVVVLAGLAAVLGRLVRNAPRTSS